MCDKRVAVAWSSIPLAKNSQSIAQRYKRTALKCFFVISSTFRCETEQCFCVFSVGFLKLNEMKESQSTLSSSALINLPLSSRLWTAEMIGSNLPDKRKKNRKLIFSHANCNDWKTVFSLVFCIGMTKSEHLYCTNI